MPSIPKLITLPNFSKVSILNIGGNNIVSVEMLSKVNMANLDELWLWKNQITKIDVLRKMYVPKLSFIDLNHNYIVEWPKFS